MIRKIKQKKELPYADLYEFRAQNKNIRARGESLPDDSPSSSLSGGRHLRLGKKNPFFQDRDRSATTDMSSKDDSSEGRLSPRKSPRSLSMSIAGELGQTVVIGLTDKEVSNLLEVNEELEVLPHSCLLMMDIQLQKQSLSGMIFHLVMLMEEAKSMEGLFGNSEQWSYVLENVTTNGWVTSQTSHVQHLLQGSKQ